MSSFDGQHIGIEIFGSSHGPRVGVTVRGFPTGFCVDIARLQDFLKRRAPGRDALSSPRAERDVPVFLSGLTDGKTDGRALRAVISNEDARPGDYEDYANRPRPGHADYTARIKYGKDYDASGGGAFSGRMTAPLCVAGGIALQMLESEGICVQARILSAAGVSGSEEEIREAIRTCQAEGDSAGAVVECVARGIPAGLGGPLFDGLESRLANMLFVIPAVKGAEFGAGFAAAAGRGSEFNDAFEVRAGRVITKTNHCGGILGGITTGMDLVFRVAFKPTPSIEKEQDTVDLQRMQAVRISVKGRHDPCVALRALPAVEAAAALVILDALLDCRSQQEEASALQQQRSEIRRIDARMMRLFEERLRLVEEIAEIKRESGLPVYDAAREEEALKEAGDALPKELQRYGKAFQQAMMDISKSHQYTVNGESGDAQNIVLIGMPGCGKTSVARALGALLARPVFDCDEEIEKRTGRSVQRIFEEDGEETFRRLESEVLCELCKQRRVIIAAGGGCITREENLPVLRKNGRIVWIRRDLSALDIEGRPLSKAHGVEALYEERRALYETWCDAAVDNDAGPADCARAICGALGL